MVLTRQRHGIRTAAPTKALTFPATTSRSTQHKVGQPWLQLVPFPSPDELCSGLFPSPKTFSFLAVVQKKIRQISPCPQSQVLQGERQEVKDPAACPGLTLITAVWPDSCPRPGDSLAWRVCELGTGVGGQGLARQCSTWGLTGTLACMGPIKSQEKTDSQASGDTDAGPPGSRQTILLPDCFHQHSGTEN